MPELPDVETYKRSAADPSAGRTVRRVVVSDRGILAGVSPETLRQRLEGAQIGRTRRHGKHLLIEAKGAGALAMHFGTNGALHLVHADEADPRFTRLRLEFADGDRLDYVNPRRIGNVQLATSADDFIAKAGLGPDALDPRFGLRAFEQLVRGTKRDIKTLLMDQELVAGIGNLYADEILFQARIHPATPAGALDKGAIRRLLATLKRVLKTASDRGTGAEHGVERLPKTYLLRERHAGGHCPRCGAPLATLRIGGRTTYCCPHCQRKI